MCNLRKIRPVGPEMFYADRDTNGKTGRRTDERTDKTKLLISFCKYVKARKIEYLQQCPCNLNNGYKC